MSFTSRLLLFDDNVCIGLFISVEEKNANGDAMQKNVTLSILLSASGDFLRISRNNEVPANHLTRFVPSRYSRQVQCLLDFRNMHTSQPFLCERFSRKFDNASGSRGTTICPLERRLLSTSSFEYYPDRLVDSGYRSASNLHTPLLAHLSRVYPAGLVEDDLLRAGRQGRADQRAAQDIGQVVPADLTQAFACSASGAGQFSALFDSMGAEVAMLFSADAYPAPMSERMVVMERVDSCTYTVNRSIDEAPSRNTFEFDAWVDANRTASEFVLTLRGSYVALRWLGDADEVQKHEFHTSLLDFALEDEPQPLAFGGSQASPIDQLRGNRAHLLRLLRLREYIEQHRPSFALRDMKMFRAASAASRESAEDLSCTPISLAVDGIRYTALSRFENKDHVVYSVHGMFPDHTILELDPKSGVISAVLSGGDTRTYDLAALFTRVANASPEEKLTPPKNPLGQATAATPQGGATETVLRHIKSLLAFHRWARTPAHVRPSLDEDDQRISAVARASVLQSQRFILLQQLSAGKITYEEAAKISSALSQGLQLAGRDLDEGDARARLRHSVENEPFENQKTKVDSSALENAIPVPITDPLLYRQQVQKRIRAALSEANKFLDDSNAFLKSCL